jgi:hypothetical protein
MKALKYLVWILLAILLLSSATMASVGAGGRPAQDNGPAGLVIPSGFEKITSIYGAELFRKDYSNGTPDFVQVADLALGAEIKLLHGPVREKREGRGAYGGDDPRLLSRSLQQYWNEFASTYANPFCVVNGQFFYMPESPTRLPFPLKVDGEIVSDGFGKDQFPGQKLMLELWPGRADIKLLTKEALYGSDAPDIVAGLAEDAPKAIAKRVGRTFVGLVDKDGNRQFETVLIFSTRTASQAAAAAVLREFGAQKVMMLDGGGSTQMICRDKNYISSERLIPQAIAVQGGVPSSPVQAEISTVQLAVAEQAPQVQASPEAYPPPESIVQNETVQVSPEQAEIAQSLPVQGETAQVSSDQVQTAQVPPDAQVKPEQIDPAQSLPLQGEAAQVAPEQVGVAQSLPLQGDAAPVVSEQVEIAQSETVQVSPAQNETAQSMPDQADIASITASTGEVAASDVPQSQSRPLYDLGDALWVPGMMAPGMAFILLIILRMRFG